MSATSQKSTPEAAPQHTPGPVERLVHRWLKSKGYITSDFYAAARAHDAEDREQDAIKADLLAALTTYLARGLALQRIVGEKFDGPEMERLGILSEWEMACLEHGRAIEVIERARGRRRGA